MSTKEIALALCVGAMAGVFVASSCMAATSIRPAMRSVVACVYDMVRTKHGLLSIDVYSVGTEKYVIEYKFRDNGGTTFTGGIGIHDGVMGDGNYFYTNDTPAGQADDHGLVELDFLCETIYVTMKKCHLMPGFDNRIRLNDETEPPHQKVEMQEPSN